MRRWKDVLPPEIAKEQTAWERRARLLRLSECGVSKQKLQIFAGNISRVFLNYMLRTARAKQHSPIEAWVQDKTPIQELARKIDAKLRYEARKVKDQQ